MSHVQVSCPLKSTDTASKTEICDQFEVGIIGNLEYDVYDIAIMITDAPDTLLVEEDLAAVSFRMSHLDDSFLLWFAGVRLVCVFISCGMILLYFLTSCKRDGFNINAYMLLNFN